MAAATRPLDPGADRTAPALPPMRVNVGPFERLVSAAAGVAVLAWCARTRKVPLLLVPLGAGLLARAVTGHSIVNQLIGRDTANPPTVGALASVRARKAIRVERAIAIARSPMDLYDFWRHFENLPRFMDHVESVITVDPARSHWIAKGPAGVKLEWDAEILNEEPGERIAWRSLPGADVHHAGSVHFRPAPDGLSTEVRVIMSYEPPLGRFGATVAKILGENPAKQVTRDLQHFKQLMETGEVPALGKGRRDHVS